MKNKIDPSSRWIPKMADPAEQQDVDDAAALQAATDQAIEACGGDPRAAVTALIVANSMLERELADVYAKASKGYIRGQAEGRHVIVRTSSVVL
jgi:hypothetical protein